MAPHTNATKWPGKDFFILDLINNDVGSVLILYSPLLNWNYDQNTTVMNAEGKIKKIKTSS